MSEQESAEAQEKKGKGKLIMMLAGIGAAVGDATRRAVVTTSAVNSQ